MAWRISVSLERHPEALLVVQRMIYAAAMAQGATDVEAYSVARSLREAIRAADGETTEVEPAGHPAAPFQIELEYDEETLTLFVRERDLSPSVSGSAVLH
jgi:hypothetical protein